MSMKYEPQMCDHIRGHVCALIDRSGIPRPCDGKTAHFSCRYAVPTNLDWIEKNAKKMAIPS